MQFPFNEKKTIEAVTFLLKFNNGVLDIVTLNKLLFLADKAALLTNEIPITGSQIFSSNGHLILSDIVFNNAWNKRVRLSDHYFYLRNNDQMLELHELSKFEFEILQKVFDSEKNESISDWINLSDSVIKIEYKDILQKSGVSEEYINQVNDNSKLSWAMDSLSK